MTRIVPGRGYVLSGMRSEMWGAPHPTHGTPESVAAKYLGSLQGTRRWHGFEVWKDGTEQGVIFMADADLAQLTVKALPSARR